MTSAGIVIVGTSIAGVTAAATLRSEGYDGAVTLVGEEEHQPYARPPLSKAIAAGSADATSGPLSVADLEVDIRTGARAVALDAAARRVTLLGEGDLPYDGLVIATGARARTLSPDGEPGEWVLRSLDDAMRIAEAARHASSALIIGAGVLGMELASTLAASGLEVTVVDLLPPLAAQLGGQLSDLIVERARSAVTVVVSPAGVRRRTAGDHAYVELGDGSTLEADLVVTSVGCRPNVEWLRHSGLAVDHGLLLDERCRAADGIVAAGDVARVPASRGAHARRTPNWTDAINQASTAARALLRGDRAPAYQRDPYFWTEAFGLSLKVAGLLPTRGAPVVVATREDGGRLLQWHEDDRPVAAASVNYRLPIVKLKQLSRAAP